MEIKLKELSKFGKANNVEKPIRLLARRILKRIRDFKVVSPWCYQALLPEIDCRLPQNRTEVGEALGFIWQYCEHHSIPFINFLVIRKDTRLPGAGVRNWYRAKFGTAHYEGYCTLQMNLASYALANKLVTIEAEEEDEE